MPIGNPTGYGSLVLNAQGGVMSPNNKKPGQRFISTTNARAQMTPDAMRRAQQSATTSVRSSGVTKQNPVRTVRSGRPSTGSSGITTPPPNTTPRPPAGGAPDAVGNAVKKARGDGLRGLMKGKGKGIAIGMGAAVIGGLAYSGRRGEGSSGGRAGMTRY